MSAQETNLIPPQYASMRRILEEAKTDPDRFKFTLSDDDTEEDAVSIEEIVAAYHATHPSTSPTPHSTTHEDRKLMTYEEYLKQKQDSPAR